MKVGVLIRFSRGAVWLHLPGVTSVKADEGEEKKTRRNDSSVASASADSRTDGALQRQLDNGEWGGIRESIQAVVKEGRDGEQRRDGEEEEEERRRAYPGVPALSWGSAWLPLLCCSLLTET